MATPGQIKGKFNRTYIYLVPEGSPGPGVWRTSNPDGAAGGGGGGGFYDFDAIEPVEVEITPGIGANPTIAKYSLDFSELDKR